MKSKWKKSKKKRMMTWKRRRRRRRMGKRRHKRTGVSSALFPLWIALLMIDQSVIAKVDES
jgi:hypothetical protein